MQKYEIRKNKSFKVYFCSDALGCLSVGEAVGYAAVAYLVYNLLDDSEVSDECGSELKELSDSDEYWTIISDFYGIILTILDVFLVPELRFNNLSWLAPSFELCLRPGPVKLPT